MKPFIASPGAPLYRQPEWSTTLVSPNVFMAELDQRDIIESLPLKNVSREFAHRAIESLGAKSGYAAIALTENCAPEFLRNQLTEGRISRTRYWKLFEYTHRPSSTYRFACSINEKFSGKEMVVGYSARGEPTTAKLFPAQFSVLLPEQADEENYRAIYLVMRLNPQEEQELRRVSGAHSKREYLHDGGVASVELVPYRDGLFIKDIRAPLLERCGDKKLAERYKDWDKILFAVTEYLTVVTATTQKYDTPIATRTLLHPYGMMRDIIKRAIASSPTKKDEKASTRHLSFHLRTAKELPEQFGYTVRDDRVRSRQNGSWSTHRNLVAPDALVNLKSCLAECGRDHVRAHRAIVEGMGTASRATELGEFLSRESEYDRDTWWDLSWKIFPKGPARDEAKIPVTVGADSSLRMSPSEKIELGASALPAPILALGRGRFASVSADAWNSYERELRSPHCASVLAAIGPEFVTLSRGVAHGAREDWWHIPKSKKEWSVSLMHLPDQKRHPALRFVNHDSSGRPVSQLVVGTKGGGLQREDFGRTYRPGEELREWNGPFYVHLPQKRGELVLSTHLVWGGMSLVEAAAEFSVSVNLLHFLRERRPEGALPMGIPLDAAKLLSVPRWKGSDIQWESCGSYFEDFLERCPYEEHDLGVFRTIGRTEVRFLQLIDRIFLKERPEDPTIGDLEKQIVDALRYFYWVNGEKLIVPESASLVRRGTTVGPREILRFLKELSDGNGDAPHRIRKKIVEPLLWAHGEVHRNGGHFGGVWLQRNGEQFGAFGGGPAAIRNLSIAGEMRDIDEQISVPYAVRSVTRELAEQGKVPLKQAGDLFVLRDSFYWIDKILFGERRSDTAEPVTLIPFDKYNAITRLGNDDAHLANLKVKRVDSELRIVYRGKVVEPLEMLSRAEDRWLHGGVE